MRKLLRGALSNIRGAEGRRAHQERGAVLSRQLADGFRVHRIGVIDDAHAGDEREPQCRREAEGMEEGQHAEQHIAVGDLEHLAHGIDVGQDVLLRQHNALRDAGAAARENNGGGRIGRSGVPDEEAIQRPDRQHEREREHSDRRSARHQRHHVFQVHHAGHRLNRGLRQKQTRRQNRFDPALADRVFHRLGTSRKVQVHGHLRGQRCGHVRQRPAHRGRQQQTDVGFACGAPADPAREEQARDQRTAIGEPFTARVGHAKRRPMALGRAHELPRKIFVRRPPGQRDLASKLEHGHARSRCRRRGGQRIAERHGDRIGNLHGPLPEKSAALEAEDAAPDAIEIHRNDRHVEAVDNPLEAALERQQIARSAD